MLGQWLRQRQQRPTTVQEHGAALQQECNNHDQNDFGRLVKSMPRRIRASLANRKFFLPGNDSAFMFWHLCCLTPGLVLPSIQKICALLAVSKVLNTLITVPLIFFVTCFHVPIFVALLL